MFNDSEKQSKRVKELNSLRKAYLKNDFSNAVQKAHSDQDQYEVY